MDEQQQAVVTLMQGMPEENQLAVANLVQAIERAREKKGEKCFPWIVSHARIISPENGQEELFEESNAWADLISAAIASTGIVSKETADLIVQVGEKVYDYAG